MQHHRPASAIIAEVDAVSTITRPYSAVSPRISSPQ
jgi:hypothetical protein